MNANSGSPSMASTVIKIVFIILSLYALYYLYKYLFASSGLKGDLVIGNITDANTGSSGTGTTIKYNPIDKTGDKFPVLLEGGEYSVNMWVYINDWSVRHGSNKHILTLGGVTGNDSQTNFATLLVYLGGNKNTLSVRVDTKDRSGSSTTTPGNSANSLSGSLNAPVSLTEAEITAKMTSTPSSLDGADVCDLDNIDLQKWVLLSIVLNNKTCDVYMDGKLARSCVLPSFFRVNKLNGGSTARFCDYGGFGGFISNVSFYNYALNPEQVWRYYMSGPIPEYSLMDYLKGLFTPNAISYDYPNHPAQTSST
jgi:hypothetical protein